MREKSRQGCLLYGLLPSPVFSPRLPGGRRLLQCPTRGMADKGNITIPGRTALPGLPGDRLTRAALIGGPARRYADWLRVRYNEGAQQTTEGPTVPTAKRTLDEVARLGGDIFDRQVRPALQPEDDGKFVAIDVETGDYEMDADDYAAVARLRSRKPAADVWLMRAGYPATYRMGVIR